MEKSNKLIAEFMGFKPIKAMSKCFNCGKELREGSYARYTKNYELCCDTPECSGTVQTAGATELELCWWDGGNNVIDTDSLLYHAEWNWLMPVLEKIRSMDREVLLEMDLYVGVSTNRVVVRDFRNPSLDDRQVAYTKGAGKLIDVAYKAVIEFIEDYNKNHKI